MDFFSQLEKKISQERIIKVCGLEGGAKAYFLLSLAEKIEFPLLAILKDEDESENLFDDLHALRSLLNLQGEITLFPNANPVRNGVSRRDISNGVNPIERLNCLAQIIENKLSLIVTAKDAFDKLTISKELFLTFSKEIKSSEKIMRNEFIDLLEQNGYARADFVEQPGEYSLRGEIIDFWSANLALPVRIILFEDTVEQIRSFNPNTQRSENILDKVWITPAKEVGQGYLSEYLPAKSLVFQDIDTEESERVKDFMWIRNVAFPDRETLNFAAKAVPSFGGKFAFFVDELNKWLKEKYEVHLFCSNQNEQVRLLDLFEEKKMIKEIPSVSIGPLNTGFILPREKLAVISANDIFGRYKIRRRLPKFKLARPLETLYEINPGDYVVHERCGIGLYRGLEHLLVEDKYADFLHLEYRGGDKLYVPVTDFRLIQKYVGPEGYRPRLYSLDGITWERVKQRVKESLHDFARELLQIYAQREISRGYNFPEDSYIEKEFSATFPYEETPDQAKAIEEVKQDMSLPKPMDRLVVGDVGYGKTEVAIRAALKSALAGKQTALLVPTTILAEQHYRNFAERFAQYPVNIDMLSRFRSKKEQQKILADLKKGLIDIIIGTHRLLQKDIEFHDLGLVIIDEEHRFGVRAKEKLKRLRATVDVLTLSATPIPRTLSMVLSGIRNVSYIETPPEGRLPIETYIGPYDEGLAKNAILSEINRGGQVFFVHNRIETIYVMLEHLEKIMPGIRFGLAHGQMSSQELENVMHKFLSRKYDVLLSTSIIEAGLDLPQVNTLIVDKSEEFGLAQLYQLRGRVGRGDQKAYGYLFYSPESPLSEPAVKRLRALYEFTTLGSGLQLALRDLEIRGAGNIFGPQQHGFLGELGYDLYCRLLKEEIKKLKGEAVEEEKEIVFDFPTEAYFPEEYIGNSATRIIFYKRILAAESENELSDLRNELEDRFGKIPQPASNLFSLAELRRLAKKMKVNEIKLKGKTLEISFDEKATLTPQKLNKLTRVALPNVEKVSFVQEKGLRLRLHNFPQTEIIIFLKKYLLKVM